MPEFTSLNGYTVKDETARNIAKGRNQAVAFNNYASMVTALNAMEKNEYKTGQNIYIGVVGVPDLWVYAVENTVHTFSYVSDADLVDKLTANTTIQVGYYKLAMLEGQKVDLTTYNERITELETAFPAGCSKIAAAVTEMGVATASNASPDTIVANIMKLGAHIINEGGSTSIDVSSHPKHKEFTEDNFFVCVDSVYFLARQYAEISNVSRTDNVCQKSYNANTGVLTISNKEVNYKGSGGRTDHCGITVNYTVYLVY